MQRIVCNFVRFYLLECGTRARTRRRPYELPWTQLSHNYSKHIIWKFHGKAVALLISDGSTVEFKSSPNLALLSWLPLTTRITLLLDMRPHVAVVVIGDIGRSPRMQVRLC